MGVELFYLAKVYNFTDYEFERLTWICKVYPGWFFHQHSVIFVYSLFMDFLCGFESNKG
jgi:hypothetical protein